MSTKNNISYFKAPIRNTQPYKDVSPSDVAKVIKGNHFKTITDKLRSITDADEAKKL